MTLPEPPLLLAVDIGTTNVKAALVDERGGVRDVRAVRCATRRMGGRHHVQDPAELLRAAETAIEAVASHAQPAAIVLSSAMHGILPIDGDHRPLGPLSTWAEPLGGERGWTLREFGRGGLLHRRTGTPIHPCNLALRLPAVAGLLGPSERARLAAWVSAKELLLRHWCGAAVVDASLASSTGLFETVTGTWDREALELAEVSSDQLSRIVPVDHVLTSWRPRMASRLGLRREVPVVVGASDGVLAHLGVGGDDRRVTSVTLGTSGAARRAVAAGAAGKTDLSSTGLFRYVLDSTNHVIGGAVSHVGRCLEWAADLFHGSLPRDQRVARLLQDAAAVDAADPQPEFSPHLGAERFPGHDLDDLPRGSWQGLGYGHGPGHLQFAVVDGVVRRIAAIVVACDDYAAAQGATTAGPVRCGGGLLRSDFLAARLAAAIGRPIEVAASVESSLVGAARLGRRALGLRDAFEFATVPARP